MMKPIIFLLLAFDAVFRSSSKLNWRVFSLSSGKWLLRFTHFYAKNIPTSSMHQASNNKYAGLSFKNVMKSLSGCYLVEE